VRASEQRRQAIIDDAPAAIYLKDTAGHYLMTNRHYERLFHLSRATVRGQTDVDHFPRMSRTVSKPMTVRWSRRCAPRRGKRPCRRTMACTVLADKSVRAGSSRARMQHRAQGGLQKTSYARIALARVLPSTGQPVAHSNTVIHEPFMHVYLVRCIFIHAPSIVMPCSAAVIRLQPYSRTGTLANTCRFVHVTTSQPPMKSLRRGLSQIAKGYGAIRS